MAYKTFICHSFHSILFIYYLFSFSSYILLLFFYDYCCCCSNPLEFCFYFSPYSPALQTLFVCVLCYLTYFLPFVISPNLDCIFWFDRMFCRWYLLLMLVLVVDKFFISFLFFLCKNILHLYAFEIFKWTNKKEKNYLSMEWDDSLTIGFAICIVHNTYKGEQ